MNDPWKITLRVYRKHENKSAHYQDFPMEVSPEEYILDAIERVWAFQDRSLTFNHACHHSVCGACGMRINSVEKLTCITPVRDVTADGGVVLVEPLRNFPVVSDLVVDTGSLQRKLDSVHAHQVLKLEQAPPEEGVLEPDEDIRDAGLDRLVDCIECGLCVSACPVAATSEDYLGPAVLAAAQQETAAGWSGSLQRVDAADGVWRCHSAFECSAVCPSHVDPAGRIMDLRRRVVAGRFRSVFGRKRSKVSA